MALGKDMIASTYPLPVYNYRVSIESLTLGFSEVSGLQVEYEPVTYKHGLSFAMGSKIIPGMRQPIKVIMKRGMLKKEGSDATQDSFLSDWMNDTYADPFRNHKKDILIDLCDEKGRPVIQWKVQGALPIKIEAPTFSANSNDVAIETMEVIAHGLEVSYP